MSYPSLKNKVGVTFKPRDQWSGSISNMYVGHDLGDTYSVELNYYNGLNQIDKSIDRMQHMIQQKIIVYVLPLLGKVMLLSFRLI